MQRSGTPPRSRESLNLFQNNLPLESLKNKQVHEEEKGAVVSTEQEISEKLEFLSVRPLR